MCLRAWHGMVTDELARHPRRCCVYRLAFVPPLHVLTTWMSNGSPGMVLVAHGCSPEQIWQGCVVER